MTEEIFENPMAETEVEAVEETSDIPAEAADIPDVESESAEDMPPGVTEEGLRRFLNARHAREIEADMRLREHFVRLNRQAEALKEQYPGFDLAKEMQDPTFARLTAPGVDIDPGTAYEIVHRRSLDKARQQAELQKAAKAVVSGSFRPSESALAGTHISVPVRTDPRNLSSDDLRDIRRRVERGERVTF